MTPRLRDVGFRSRRARLIALAETFGEPANGSPSIEPLAYHPVVIAHDGCSLRRPVEK